MTPLGSPVLPLEKTTVASLSNAGVPAAAKASRSRSGRALKGGVGDRRSDTSETPALLPSGSRAVPKTCSSRPTGRSHAPASAKIFSAKLGFETTSSSKTGWHGILSFSFPRKVLDVTTVLIPHWQMQEASV